MSDQPKSIKRENILFFVMLAVHVILNLIVAARVEVHFDEAYYWLYAMHPQFGYFDHPPMVAWLVMAGQVFFNGTLGLRLFSVLLNGASLCLLWWLVVRKYQPKAFLFWSLYYSILLIHPYSIFVTPDAPLLFFTILFFCLYEVYLYSNRWQTILLLAFTIALMVFSKYHAVLIIAFTLLSFPGLFKKWSFWIIVLLSLVYLSPHLVWQIESGFPSIKYHLIESHQSPYKLKITLEYVFNQLLLTGPWLGWLFLYRLVKVHPDDQWEKALKYCGVGVFVFFLLTTLGGDFEAHWTLVACIPLIILSYKWLSADRRWSKWVMISGGVNFIVLLMAKIIIMTPVAEQIPGLKTIAGWRKSDLILKEKSGGLPVVFQDCWNHAARYAYNTSDIRVAHLNSAFYRRNQYSLLDLDEELTGETVFLVSRDPSWFTDADTLVTNRTTYYTKVMKNFRSYYNMTFDTTRFEWPDHRIIRSEVIIHNPYDKTLVFSQNEEEQISFLLCAYGKNGWKTLASQTLDSLSVAEGSEAGTQIELAFPEVVEPGQELYLTMKIGQLKPLPEKIRLR